MSIAFRQLHKGLGGREILRGIDLVAATERITLIIGPSGAGKSVTARHAAGLMRPDAGEVHVLGRRRPGGSTCCCSSSGHRAWGRS